MHDTSKRNIKKIVLPSLKCCLDRSPQSKWHSDMNLGFSNFSPQALIPKPQSRRATFSISQITNHRLAWRLISSSHWYHLTLIQHTFGQKTNIISTLNYSEIEFCKSLFHGLGIEETKATAAARRLALELVAASELNPVHLFTGKFTWIWHVYSHWYCLTSHLICLKATSWSST